MCYKNPSEKQHLEMCEYFENFLSYGSRSSVSSALELLSRDQCPYMPILKAKGIIKET
tara:strand:- start:65 stop:238 length:174 start_codon:yes stop_codon:yes gene_type:complete